MRSVCCHRRITKFSPTSKSTALSSPIRVAVVRMKRIVRVRVPVSFLLFPAARRVDEHHLNLLPVDLTPV